MIEDSAITAHVVFTVASHQRTIEALFCILMAGFELTIMNGQNRSDIQIGMVVDIVLKQDQPTGSLTRGVVQDILTNSEFHPHGIKVRLETGQVGRVQHIEPQNSL